jgi:single-strand DNA-binding protein
MSTLKNKVSLIGRIGQKPTLQEVTGGYTVTRFSVATNERKKNKNGEYEDVTQWHNVKAWGKLAERIAKLLDKGSEVVIEGRLVHQQYESKSGEKRSSSEVELNEFILINKKESK